MSKLAVADPNHLRQSKSSSKVSSTRLKCHAFVDFDGTIVPRDATDFLFERFADPSWREVEADWQTGKIGSRECLTRQVALIRAEPDALLSAIGELSADSGFPRFVRECANSGIDVTVVSDGFDYVIENVLRNAGVDIPFKANHLEYIGDKRWRVTFPNARDSCAELAGNCKCSFTEHLPTTMKIVIGDGRSDFCVAQRADLVFAKASLLDLCRDNAMVHFPFDNFHEVTEKLGSWLSSSAPKRGGEPSHLSSLQGR
jgi:2-hydroxy-3-keto-5-methylthiopentenyl-1-phosphate phosphatase